MGWYWGLSEGNAKASDTDRFGTYFSQGHFLLPSSPFTIFSVNFPVYAPLYGERSALSNGPKNRST